MTIVFDSTPLNHFGRAHRLSDLEAITAGHRRVTTEAVRGELEAALARHPDIDAVLRLPWLEVVSTGSLQELRLFAEYARRLGAGPRNVGEASVLAWAEVNGAIAIVDERAATNHGRERGVEVHGSLWLICEGYRIGQVDQPSAEGLADALRDTEVWFPCSGGTFFDWARREGLLPVEQIAS
jgi:predicted nucleic acid-binding protein